MSGRGCSPLGPPPQPAPGSRCLGRVAGSVAADSQDGAPTCGARLQTRFQATAVSPIGPSRATPEPPPVTFHHTDQPRGVTSAAGTPDAPTPPGCAHHRLSGPAQPPPGRSRRGASTTRERHRHLDSRPPQPLRQRPTTLRGCDALPAPSHCDTPPASVSVSWHHLNCAA